MLRGIASDAEHLVAQILRRLPASAAKRWRCPIIVSDASRRRRPGRGPGAMSADAGSGPAGRAAPA